MRPLIMFAALTLLLNTYALADQVSLNNGDRMTGTITKSDGKTLVLHTADAGDVTVNWSAVAAVKSDKPLHVDFSNGKTAVGEVATTDDKLQVSTSSGPVSVPLADVKGLEQQTDYEKLERPFLWQQWKGGVNAGFSLTGGNSQTTNLALGFLAARQTLRDKLSAYANSVYATTKITVLTPGIPPAPPTPVATSTTTANTEAGGARYDRDFDAKLFGFGSADFFADALQSLNLRSVFSGGVGEHAIKNENTTLDFLAGLNYTHESYVTLSRNLIALTLGEELMHKLGKSTLVNEKLYFFPDLNSPGDFRGTFDLATVTKIAKRFGWQNSFSDVYVTNPPPGKRQNDLILTTGLNVAFGE